MQMRYEPFCDKPITLFQAFLQMINDFKFAPLVAAILCFMNSKYKSCWDFIDLLEDLLSQS